MCRRSLLIFIAIGCSTSALAMDYAWKPIERSEAAGGGVSVTGRVIPQDGALNIESARVAGRVLTILRREGEAVSVGTPLYWISSAECSSLGEERRVAVAKNIPELIEGVQNREQQLGLRIKNEQCAVVAGHAGILTRRNLESGATFNIGDALATTLDTRRLTVEVDVPERDQARVKAGQAVRFQFASNPGEVFRSKIQNAVPTIDPVTRTSKARLKPTRLPGNVSLDALVFGEIETGKSEPILSVPSTALVFFRNRQYVISGGEEAPAPVPVLVVNENDHASSIRPAQAGALREGDLVATKDAIFLMKRLQQSEETR